MKSADRTRSNRWRNGTRRNKRLRNTRPVLSSYDASWQSYVKADGTRGLYKAVPVMALARVPFEMRGVRLTNPQGSVTYW